MLTLWKIPQNRRDFFDTSYFVHFQFSHFLYLIIGYLPLFLIILKAFYAFSRIFYILYSACQITAGVLIQKTLDFFELSYTDIYYNKYGKPLISCKDDAFFNISHSGNIVVCAVSDYQIGVDIEEIQCFEENVLKCAFLQSEISHIRNHSFDLNYDFTKLWTAKESIVKYLGLGFSLDPLKLYFNNEVQDEIYCDGKKLSKLFFKTYDLNGYVITVCSECETFSENIEWFVPE